MTRRSSVLATFAFVPRHAQILANWERRVDVAGVTSAQWTKPKSLAELGWTQHFCLERADRLLLSLSVQVREKLVVSRQEAVHPVLL